MLTALLMGAALMPMAATAQEKVLRIAMTAADIAALTQDDNATKH